MTSRVQHQQKMGRQRRNPVAEFHYRSFLVELENRKENFTRFAKKK